MNRTAQLKRNLTQKKLRCMCKLLGLPVSGNKESLARRIAQRERAAGPALARKLAR